MQLESGLIVPQMLELRPGFITPMGRDYFAAAGIDSEFLDWAAKTSPMAGGSGTLSNYGETHVLEHVVGKTTFALPTTYLCLLTVIPDSSKTGATVTNATYTGYVPLALASAFSAAVSGGAGAASTITNSGVLTFGACTAGSSTVVGWEIQDNSAAGSGNVIAWGTCTSVVISTTQTPPTIAASALSLTLI